MRAAKDLLSLFDFAGAPTPAPAAPASVACVPAAPPQVSLPASSLATALPALRPATQDAAALTPPAHRARGQLGRVDLWRADDLPAEDVAGTQPTGFPLLDAELPGGGWPQGQLVEALLDAPGLGELSLFAPALAAVSAGQRAGVWVLPVQPARRAALAPPLPYAPALDAAGIDLARCMFVQPATARESWWAFEQSLHAGHLGAVIGWLPDAIGSDGDFRALRRLHLLAARQRALVVVLRSTRHATAPSPAAVRLHLVQHGGRLRLQLLKRRGRPLLDPVTLQVHPEAWRQARVALPAAAEPVEVPADPARLSTRAAQRGQRWSMKALFSH
jgi:protein ImuA